MNTWETWCQEHKVTISSKGGERKIDAEKGKRKGWEHFAWSCTLTFQGRTLTTPYKCGVAHVDRYGRPKAPSAAQVLACLLTDAQGVDGATFAEWCADLGESEDSRKALTMYLACQETLSQLRTFFGTREAYAEALEATRDY
jgi:hypothetical protein